MATDSRSVMTYALLSQEAHDPRAETLQEGDHALLAFKCPARCTLVEFAWVEITDQAELNGVVAGYTGVLREHLPHLNISKGEQILFGRLHIFDVARRDEPEEMASLRKWMREPERRDLLHGFGHEIDDPDSSMIVPIGALYDLLAYFPSTQASLSFEEGISFEFLWTTLARMADWPLGSIVMTPLDDEDDQFEVSEGPSDQAGLVEWK